MVLSALATVGLLRGGFESRFDPEVVKLDQARNPQIPFRKCDGRPLNEACVLGAPAGVVKTLIWGDSHALAWAPALDEVFRDKGERALFANSSACPPMVDAHNAIKPVCASQNQAVQDFLLKHPAVETVVLAAYWSTYFKNDGPISATREGVVLSGVHAAHAALSDSLAWLQQAGRRVVLIGPVPVYERSVPLALALGAATSRELLRQSVAEQLSKHAPFFEVAAAAGKSAHFLLANPIDWLCKEGGCAIIADANPLYRDSHHLSVAGAMAMKPQLTEVLGQLADRRSSDPSKPLSDSAAPITVNRHALRAPERAHRIPAQSLAEVSRSRTRVWHVPLHRLVQRDGR
ncbi:MAG: SGNH hydrolase domain-containing protein [Burkholderiaceae bacterium]